MHLTKPSGFLYNFIVEMILYTGFPKETMNRVMLLTSGGFCIYSYHVIMDHLPYSCFGLYLAGIKMPGVGLDTIVRVPYNQSSMKDVGTGCGGSRTGFLLSFFASDVFNWVPSRLATPIEKVQDSRWRHKPFG